MTDPLEMKNLKLTLMEQNSILPFEIKTFNAHDFFGNEGPLSQKVEGGLND